MKKESINTSVKSQIVSSRKLKLNCLCLTLRQALVMKYTGATRLDRCKLKFKDLKLHFICLKLGIVQINFGLKLVERVPVHATHS